MSRIIMLVSIFLFILASGAYSQKTNDFCMIIARVDVAGTETVTLDVLEVIGPSGGVKEGPSCESLYADRTLVDVSLIYPHTHSEQTVIKTFVTYIDHGEDSGYAIGDSEIIRNYQSDDHTSFDSGFWSAAMRFMLFLLVLTLLGILIILQKHRG